MDFIIAATPAPAVGGFNPTMIIMMVAMLGLLFFMQSRAKKQARQRDEFRTALQPGQRVMTQGGLVGTIVAINDETVILDSAGSRCEYMRAGIAKTLDAAPVTQGMVDATVAAANEVGVVPAPHYGANVAPVAAAAAAPAAGGFLANALGNLAAAQNTGPVVSDDDLAELDAISRDYYESRGDDAAVSGPVVVIEEE